MMTTRMTTRSRAKRTTRTTTTEHNTGNSKECNQEEALDVQLVLKSPYPSLLMFNFVWDQPDRTAINSLMVMASLPWEGFIPNFYTEENMQDESIFKTVYKL